MPASRSDSSLGSLLARSRGGDATARDRLTPTLRSELRAAARRRLPLALGTAADPSTLIDEACARLLGSDPPAEDRRHFEVLAARVVREALVDHARREQATRHIARGRVPTGPPDPGGEGAGEPASGSTADVLALDRALSELARTSPEAARLAEVRLFAGLDVAGAADVLGLPLATAEANWREATERLRGAPAGGPPTPLPETGLDLAPLAEDERLEPGARLGPYRVLEFLNAGGMGHVYLAEQKEPIERRVALKVLRVSLDDAEARRRFAAERHAMGRLDHPNVGKILDAGATEDGTAYLAMERIEGEPITAYCDARSLPLDERLRLFVQACRGVDHAHHKLLLHRDIKPSNILVAEVDGRRVPKLIDFGIAMLLDRSLGGGTPRRRLVGTPRYMSPEALGEGGDLDTRSDVFSLGVLLYQLLTGRLPWPGDDPTLERLRRERSSGEPRRPSTAVATLDESDRRRLAERYGEPTASLVRRLRGDLDWIVLKAIAVDPEDRYGSAAELADDVERFLASEPIAARPPSTLYALGKALRRHRAGAAAAAAVVLALAVGAVGTAIGLVRARSQAEAAARARDEAEAVTSFLTATFAASGLYDREATTPPSELTAREILDRGAERIDRELLDQPRVRARVEATIGSVYKSLQLYEPAKEHLEAALAQLEAEPSVEPRLLANALIDLGGTEVYLAQREEAGRHLERALALIAGGEETRDREIRGNALLNLGRLRRLAGDYAGSETALSEAVEIYGSLPGPEAVVDAGSALVNLGHTYFTQHRWAEAEAEFRRALALFETVLKPGHSRLATVTDNLGAALASQGKLAEAAPFFEQALAMRRHLLGDRAPQLAISLNNLGVLYRDLGRPEKAEGVHREALSIREEAFGERHPATAWSFDNLAQAVADLGRREEARVLERRALAIREALNGPDHVDVARSLDLLADLAVADGDYRGARPLRERSLAIERAQFEEDDPQIGKDTVDLGVILWHLGERDAARERFREGLALLTAAGEDGAKDLAWARAAVAELGPEVGEVEASAPAVAGGGRPPAGAS